MKYIFFQFGPLRIVKRVDRRDKDRPLYYLKNLDGSSVPHSYYKEELKLLPEGPQKGVTFRVKRIIKSRKVDGKKEYLCSFEFYPKSMNRWVKEENLVK